MNNRLKHIALLLILAITTIGGVRSQEFPAQSNRLVNDYASVLSTTQANTLERKLRAFNDSTSNQIVVVTINDLQGMSASQYATELAHKWGVGQKGRDNGVMILIKPKVGSSKGEYFIAVGYGLEGAIPDAMASRVGSTIMVPELMKNDYYAALDKASTVLMQLSQGEYEALEDSDSTERTTKMVVYIVFGIIFLVVMFGKRNTHNDNNSGGNGGRGSDADNLLTGMIIGSMLGGHRGGRYGGGGSGFGGFGGGGFGGGGAGGSW